MIAAILRVTRMGAELIRRPDLFIIGAPKSGTSSLYEYLRDHPQVFMSPVKEPAYFSPDVPSPRNRYPHGDLESYLSLFAGAKDEKRVGEASTYYLYSRLAPELIREFQPGARIVAILRNPVDMAYAMHGHRLEHGAETIDDFAAALAADMRDDAGGPERKKVIERAGTYLDRARYAEQLARWLTVFPREQCHVIIFDDFTADTPAAFRRLLEFLDVDPGFRPASFEARNASHRLRGGIVTTFMRSRLAGYLRHGLLPQVIGRDGSARLGRQVKHSRLVRSTGRRAPLDPGLRKQLEEELASDVARLGEMLGRDLLSEWFGRTSATSESPAEALVAR